VAAVRGSARSSLTDGVICGKVAAFAQHMYCEDRLDRPLLRVGPKGEGRFRPVSWDEALDVVARRFAAILEEHGGEAILPCSYGGSNGYLTEGAADARLFHRLGATNLARTLCAMPSTRAQVGMSGRMVGMSLEDVVHARSIVLWGVNPSATSIHLVSRITEARKRGATLVVVDPRRIPLARTADLHLSIRPGTDLPLALAVAHELFENGDADRTFLARHANGVEAFEAHARRWSPERAASETGIEADEIRRFARLYAAASPAWIRCGWGVERSRNGGAGTFAVLALAAVAGKFGVRGGGVTMSNTGAWKLSAGAAAAAPAPPTRWVNLGRLGRALTELRDPPIAGLFVYNGNPLSTCPDQAAVRRGLEREDLFTVVHEQVMTDTARYADVVLPATTFLEHDDLMRSYGNLALHRIRPVVAAFGESRPNHRVFDALCDRLGLARPDDARDPDDMVAAILAADLDGRGAELAAGLASGAVMAPSVGDRPIQFVDCFPQTSDQKLDLYPDELAREARATGPEFLEYRPDPGTDRHPLALISPAHRSTISSTFGQLNRRQAKLRVHPDDARCRGITNGDRVRIFNDLGQVFVRARVTDMVRPGVVSLPKGLWARHTETGDTANSLIPDTLTDLGGGLCFNDARVQVEPASAGAAPEAP
jgi:anaerobic selenocysteine-containing dehydrogenase